MPALCWALWLAWGLVQPVGAQDRRLDYLNDKLPVPESVLFDEPRYIDTGVGLSFGVDLQLAYISGQYGEAVQRFEKAVGQYRFKSEIWVYLSRSYFYLNQPEEARNVLLRATAQMPDLQETLWLPLRRGLEFEIARRAAQLQIQVNYYARGQDDFLRLFRLYLFLEDYRAANQVVVDTDARVEISDTQASALGTKQSNALRLQAEKWVSLGQQLRAELVAADQLAPPPLKRADRQRVNWRQEADRLQRQIDFYPATLDDFGRLFDLYVELGDVVAADSVQAAVGRHRRRLEFDIATAVSLPEEAELKQELSQFDILLQRMRLSLELTP